MTDQPLTPEQIMELAAQPAGGPEEARLSPEQRAEVEEQRAVRRMLSSLPSPQLTPEEQRDLRRAVHAAAAESARAVPAPPARRRRWSRAWPALAAAASLAVLAAVALNLRDLGDTVTEQVAVTAAPTTAAATRVETTAAPTTTAAAAEMMAEAPESAADLAAVGVTEETADASAPEDAPQTDEEAPQAAAEPQPAAAPTEVTEREVMFSRAWAESLPRFREFREGDDGYSEEELADQAREISAGRPDAFPLPYSDLEEYAAATGLACWDYFAAGTDDDRTTVLFAGRAWIGDYWYEVYYVETDYPDAGLRETVVAFTPPGGLPGTATENNSADADSCWPLSITEH